MAIHQWILNRALTHFHAIACADLLTTVSSAGSFDPNLTKHLLDYHPAMRPPEKQIFFKKNNSFSNIRNR